MSKGIESQYIIRTISSRSTDSTGKKLMGQLSKDFDFVVNGTPHILMIDPVINKVEGIVEGKVLATAERNTVDLSKELDYIQNPWVGYNSLRVKELLEKATAP